MTRPRVRALLSASCPVLLLSLPAQAQRPVEVLEIGRRDSAELPRGKEADGILGDFVLRNEHVEALVGGNLPRRKANMGTNWGSETPGCLYDLAVRGSDNDQLTCFAPGALHGPVSSVSAGSAGGAGAAGEIAVTRSAARGGGREETHRYTLGAGARHLEIRSTYRNLAGQTWEVDPAPEVKGLRDLRTFAGVHFADAMNPIDRQGYAWAPGSGGSWDAASLGPGESRTFVSILAPGRSPAQAFGIVAARRGSVGTLVARLHSAGAPVVSARMLIGLDDGTPLPAYPDDDGRIEAQLPPGTYRYQVRDAGREAVRGTLEVREGARTELDVPLGPQARVHFEVADSTPGGRRRCPCKVQFIGIDPTPNPVLGVDINARGCRNQVHSESGSFSVAIPPGEYRVVITRGIEYSHVSREISLPPGGQVQVSADLCRLVDTSGWVSTDFHNHSTPSGDNYCGTDDRVINLAAEQIEFAPTTEHNRLYDWAPNIRRLGLAEEISTVVGIELTGPGAHLNAFPFQMVPWAQDNGAPAWQEDPRINAIILRDMQGGGADRYVQINHPNVGEFFRDRDADGRADGGFVGLEDLLDAAEVWSDQILNPLPWLTFRNAEGEEDARPNRTFAWLQLLNQGRKVYCVAVSDAHSVFGNGVGGWRTYVPSSTDTPLEIDYREIVRNAKAGRMLITNGPYLEVELDDGTLPGGSTVAAGTVQLDVRVQCTDWIDVDRVQVLVNGAPLPELDFRRESHPDRFADGVVKFEGTLPVTLAEDAHLIVVAWGEGHDLTIGYGESWQSGMHPCAYTNPIFVDVDGRGFEANGDTLGHPLVVGGGWPGRAGGR